MMVMEHFQRINYHSLTIYTLIIWMLLTLDCDYTLADKCKTGCHGGTSDTFKYVDGTTYKYNYYSKIETSLSSAEGQKIQTEIKAQILLQQQSGCNQLLKVQDLQIIGTDGKKYGTIPNIDKPIRLNLNDGQLDDTICTIKDDTKNSINFKRAIASLFQINIKNLNKNNLIHETDIFGLCPTEFNIKEKTTNTKKSEIHIEKIRNLNKCAYREHIANDYLTTIYNPFTEIRTSPILDSIYKSKYTIINGIIEQIDLNENYLFLPFSNGDNGAKTQIETKLQFITKSNTPELKTIEKTINQPKTILFELATKKNSIKSNVNSILAAVKSTVKTIDLTVNELTADQYVNLIKIIRVSNKDDLLTVYNQVRAGVGFSNKQIAKTIFLNSLTQAGTGETVEVTLELLKNNELNDIEKKLIYLNFGLIKQITQTTLNSILLLLNQQQLPNEAYLGIGLLINNYCQLNQCKNLDVINKLIQRFTAKLGDGKPDNIQEENELIFVLKGVKNSGQITDGVVPKILGIAQDKKASTRLRVIALETYLADPCRDKLRDSALNILKDTQQDAEIRIKGYQVLTKCPNAKIAGILKNLLEIEPSLQVGGYIVSHLRNLRSTTNLAKLSAKNLLASINLPKRFPFDFRKYSVNADFSYNLDSVGLANDVEADLIYSQNSFLPRSVNLNITSNLYGHNFNFLDIQLRQENLDRLFEKYLGPRSELKQSNFWNLLQKNGNLIQTFSQKFQDKFQKIIRNRRDLNSKELDQISKLIQYKTNDLNKNLDIDLSLKLFGKELIYLNLNDQKILTPDLIIDQILDGLQAGLDEIKNFEKTVQKNLLFLDLELDYPTSTGFPIRLNLEGITNIQIIASGNLDIKKFLNSNSGGFSLKLIPSINLQLNGRFTFDTDLVENGLKISTKLFAAYGNDLKFEIIQDNKSGFDLKFKLPIKKNQLTLTHSILFETREYGFNLNEKPLKFAQNKDFSIGFDQLQSLIGLTLIVETDGPNLSGKQIPILPFPLNGYSKFNLELINDGTDDIVYHVNSLIDQLNFKFLIEVLNQKNDKISIEIDTSLNLEPFIKLSINTPIKNINGLAQIKHNSNEIGLELSLKYDQLEYYSKFGFTISGDRARTVYKPIVVYRQPNAPDATQHTPFNVKGQIVVERTDANTNYVLDNLEILLPTQQNLKLDGNFGKKSSEYYIDLNLLSDNIKKSIKSKLLLTNGIKLNLEYLNTGNRINNFNLKFDGLLLKNLLDINLQLIHGDDLSSKINKLIINNLIKFDLTENVVKFKIVYPKKQLNTKFELVIKPKKSYNLDAEFELKNLKFGTEFELEFYEKFGANCYKFEFEIYGFNNRLELKSSYDLIKTNEGLVRNLVEINDKKLEINGNLLTNIKPQDLLIKSNLIIKFTGLINPLKYDLYLKSNSEEFDFNQKLIDGTHIYLDNFLKISKNFNFNGNFKINLKSKLLIQSQIKSINGQGVGDLSIDLIPYDRVIKSDLKFNYEKLKIFNFDLNFWPNFKNDQKHLIKISTDNNYDKQTLISKNLIDFFNQQFLINLKTSLTAPPSLKNLKSPDWSNHHSNNELEIILPNQHYFLFKLLSNHHLLNNLLNGDLLINLEDRPNKNASGRKFLLKQKIANTNLAKFLLNFDWNLFIDYDNEQNINQNIIIKFEPNNNDNNDVNGRKYEFFTKISGTIFDGVQEFKLNGQYLGKNGDFRLGSTSGSISVLDIDGKYDLTGGDKPITGDLSIELTPNNKIIKTFKLKTGGSIKKPQKSDDYFELTGSGSLYIDDQTRILTNIDGNTEIKLKKTDGKFQLILRTTKKFPITINFNYNQQINDDIKKNFQTNLLIKWDEKKKIDTTIDITKLPENELKLLLKLSIPTEKNSENLIFIHTKKNPTTNLYENEINFKSDEKFLFNLKTIIKFSEKNPIINLILKRSNNSLQQLQIELNKLTNKQFQFLFKLLDETSNFLLSTNLDVNLENLDNFHLNGKFDANKFDLEKIEILAVGKLVKNERKLEFSAEKNKKNLIKGTTIYHANEDNNKLIIEGSGKFYLNENLVEKSGNFKLIRRKLQDLNENGLEYAFNANLDNNAIDAEFKFTNKQLRFHHSYCEEKKECAHIEFDSKLQQIDAHNLRHDLEIAIDLKKLGLTHEFGLKSITQKNGLLLDHTVDVHFENGNNKYQYSIYFHPKETGISLTTPKRVIALESRLNYPEKWANTGRIEADLTFYLDKKNRPQEKTALIGWLDVGQSQLNGEAKLVSPSLLRPIRLALASEGQSNPLLRNNQLEIDLFEQTNKKLIVKTKWNQFDLSGDLLKFENFIELKSDGFNLNLKFNQEFAFNRKEFLLNYLNNIKYQRNNYKIDLWLNNYEITPTKISVENRLLNLDLFKLTTIFKFNKQQQIVDGNLILLNLPKISSELELKNFQTAKLQLFINNNNKLIINTGFIPGQIADFRLELLKNSQKYDLILLTLKLDEANFLKSNCLWDSPKIKDLLLKPLKENSVKNWGNLRENLRKIWLEIREELRNLGNLFDNSFIDFRNFRTYFDDEFREIYDEILKDKTIQKLWKFIRNLVGGFLEIFNDLFRISTEFLEEIYKSINISLKKIWELLEKDLWPQLQKIIDKISEKISKILEIYLDLTLSLIVKIGDIFEKIQPEIAQIYEFLIENSREFLKIITKISDNFQKILKEQYQQILTEIKSTKIFEEFKLFWKNLTENEFLSLDHFIEILNEILTNLREFIPNNDFNEILNSIKNYLIAKLKGEKIDDLHEIQQISEKIWTIIKKFLEFLLNQNQDTINQTKTTNFKFPIWKLLPTSYILPKISLINYLFNEDLPNFKQFLISIIDKPQNLLPPFTLYGLIAQGQHIFTFDGNHITFPGNCNYLFARDGFNGNFTIIGTLTNGFLTSITFYDKHDSLTIKKGGIVLENGSNKELPSRKPLLSGYRLYDSIVIESGYGVKIVCGLELFVCGIRISGYYHGRLRGLLGNGNNEPYDDFIIPSGKIVPNSNDFVNAYRTTNTCPVIKTIEHHGGHGHQNGGDNGDGHHNLPESCQKLFNGNSELKLCYPFVSNLNFKIACQHGVERNIKDTEYAIAVAYVAACNQRNIPIHVPKEFLKCHNSEKPIDLYEKFNVKIPNKLADIIILVDTVKTNEIIYKELIQPLLQQLTTDLNGKGINDINYHLITYGGDSNKWPTHQTINGGKLIFTTKAPTIKFAGLHTESNLDIFNNINDENSEKIFNIKLIDKFFYLLKTIGYDIKLVIGNTLQAETYNEGLNYRFRAEAIKSIIAVTSKQCEVGQFLPLQILSSLFYKRRDINLNLFTPLELHVRDDKHTKDVIGFNHQNVFTFTKGKKSNSELYKELNYSDYCTDFTLQNNGNVFITNNFQQTKGGQRKQFVQITSHAITEQLTGQIQHLECKCQYVSPYTAANKCKVL